MTIFLTLVGLAILLLVGRRKPLVSVRHYTTVTITIPVTVQHEDEA